ncbi:MAG: phosphoglycerate dehydrogenase [Bryobacteraceae bacterium]|jgi:D-3-phosphoglycerate dehydrogenase
MKILIAEPLASAGVKLLRERSGWEVIESNPKEYTQHLGACDALIVRSAIRVSRAVLAQAPKLKIIGRAGVGVENIDVDAATAAGVLVMTTPGGNAVSVAEHSMALLLSLARSIPQASDSTKAGRWEKKKFVGTELRSKVLGIIGLGSVGRQVARRAHAFHMRVIAYDPFVSTESARNSDVELVDLPSLYGQSDYITLHTALTPQSNRMLSVAAFEQMKPGVRIVNCARGELIDEAALAAAMLSGKVAGAALDVFETEPPDINNPLIAMDNFLATPHIGGSTEEAREIVGIRIAEQIVEYFQNGVAQNTVNVQPLTPEQFKKIGPYITLAERLGAFASSISSGNPKAVRLTYYGAVAEQNTALIRNAGLAGVLNRSLEKKANTVNSVQIAGDRGLNFAEQHEKRSTHMDSVRLDIETDQGATWVEGAVVLECPRLIQVDGIHCEAPLDGNVIFLKHDDVPGVLGFIGGVMGRNGINVATFSLGRHGAGGEAVSVIETDQPVPETVFAELLANPLVTFARAVQF